MTLGRLLIFGGGGFIGTRLAVQALHQSWEVVGADSNFQTTLNEFECLPVDITNRTAVKGVINAVQPTLVVNTAAIADIDRAQREQDLAWQINVEGAKNVAECCTLGEIRHVFFSSDAVFDGTNGPYKEEDLPNPVNVYGNTKAAAEKAVLGACPSAVVLRISLVLGFPIYMGNSFLAAIKENLKSGRVIYCPQDEIRTPVDVHTLCDSVLELGNSNYQGLLHIGCSESVDRYTLTLRLADAMGFPRDFIRPESMQAPTRAPRHKRGVLNISKAQIVLNHRLPNLDTTIQRSLKAEL